MQNFFKMNKQKFFKFDFSNENKVTNFYVNQTNIEAYNGVLNLNNKHILLVGPKKSGKSHLADLWCKKNNGIGLKSNLDHIINNNLNVFIDNIHLGFEEEKLFFVINHCIVNNLKILITTSFDINEINFLLKDLISRLKTFSYLRINQPDDDMLINVLTKLFVDKQFIINSKDIFQFIIKKTNRSYDNMIEIVKKLDTLSLEKKRQLTIPLIKEIL